MWDELINSFDLTVTKEDIKRYNEMKKKGVVKMTAQEALARLQRIVSEYENLTDEINKNCYYEGMPIREIKVMLSELNELHMTIARRNGYIKLLEEDLYENASNYVVPKAKIKKEIRKAKKELKKVCKREPKTKEEATFLWCVEIRLDERIKVLKEILKEVKKDGNGDNV